MTVIPVPVIVDVDSLISESEANHDDEFSFVPNSSNPFVFVGQDPAFANSDPGCIVVEKQCFAPANTHCSRGSIGMHPQENTPKRTPTSHNLPTNSSISATSLLALLFCFSLGLVLGCSSSNLPHCCSNGLAVERSWSDTINPLASSRKC